MGRSRVFESLYSTIVGDLNLLAILGTQTATNRRILRSFPQLQSFLLGPPAYEPAIPEGWLVIEETGQGTTVSARTQYETIFEVMDIVFVVFATTYGVADDVTDYLDAYFQWGIPQQRDLRFGNWYVFFSRAYRTKEDYAKEIKLAQKERHYRFELVAAEQAA